MTSELRAVTTLNFLPSVIQDIELAPHQEHTLMMAQQQLNNELNQSVEISTEQFHMLAKAMESRFVDMMQQIQTLQTSLMRSESQNQELQSTQTAQVNALQADLAAKQAHIASLETKIADLQKDADRRIAQEIQSKAEAVRTVQNAATSHANALTAENTALKQQILQLQQGDSEKDYQIRKFGFLKERIEGAIHSTTDFINAQPSLSSMLSDPAQTRLWCERLHWNQMFDVKQLQSFLK